jgi:hypothetical protein
MLIQTNIAKIEEKRDMIVILMMMVMMDKYLKMTAMTNVIAGSILLKAQEKVGDVNFNPA